MEKEKFFEMLYEAYENSGGDLWAFWSALNPDKPQIQRTTKERLIYLYCNQRKNKDGSTWIKRCAKIDNQDVYEFEFRTQTIPKYHGYIRLEDYVINEPQKKVIVYKFEFVASPGKEKDAEKC